MAREKKLSARILMLGIAVMILAMSIHIPNASAYPYSPSTRFNVYILDAYYTDVDNDPVDDVFVVLGFELGYSSIYDFIYEITLTMPSGASYSYYVRVLAWNDVIIIRNVFFDYATESGYYTVDVYAIMLSPYVVESVGTFIFDPPGGSLSGEPDFGVY